MSRRYLYIKRVLDVAVGSAALAVSAPVQAIVAGLVRSRLGRPVIFAQERPGRHGQPFVLYKFRTMLPVDEARGVVTNADRMTPFGRFLRSTSLDELPALWNVVRGDMSLVGPRPLRISYLERYTHEQSRRHDVRPGVTGWAQVNGRNQLTWAERIDLDLYYVDRVSFSLDLRILLRTIGAVVSTRAVNADDAATMTEFLGDLELAADGALRTRRLEHKDLAERVAWLSDSRVRDGITIAFWPTMHGMEQWWGRASQDTRRDDFCVIDGDSAPVAMFGWTVEGPSTASLYLYVHPERHGERIGSRSLRMMQRVARDHGIETLTLETKEDNAVALRLYMGAGFEETDRVGDKILMSAAVARPATDQA